MSSFDADVIIIGGGPSGVAAALELKKRNVDRVMLLDREASLGGATRHCSHSPFGMREFGRLYFGGAYGRRLQAEAERAGVDIRPHHSVVALGEAGSLTVTSPRGVEALTAKRIMIATGAREKPRSARLVSGDRPIGILTTGTLQAYAAFHGLMPFKRPLIVGSELVSFSAALTCLAHGARPVAMIEQQERALAHEAFKLFPMVMGIPFYTGTDILDIRGNARVEAVTSRRRDGRTETIACDGVLFTGRFTPEASLLLQSPHGIAEGSAGPAIDQAGRMANPFISRGNVLRAIETGGWAFREGRAVGAAIAADLACGPAGNPPVPVTFDPPVKLVIPNLYGEVNPRPLSETSSFASCTPQAAGCRWNATGERSGKAREWLPERRILVPVPPGATEAGRLHFRFEEQG